MKWLREEQLLQGGSVSEINFDCIRSINGLPL